MKKIVKIVLVASVVLALLGAFGLFGLDYLSSHDTTNWLGSEWFQRYINSFSSLRSFPNFPDFNSFFNPDTTSVLSILQYLWSVLCFPVNCVIWFFDFIIHLFSFANFFPVDSTSTGMIIPPVFMGVF